MWTNLLLKWALNVSESVICFTVLLKIDVHLSVFFFRNVQSILKSPELDAKYEKFASAASSPKSSRKKFLSSRQPANRRKRKTSANSSKTRDSPRNGSSSTTTLDSLPTSGT